MNTATDHYENANFLRELAETLPSIKPSNHKPEQVQLLQQLADRELEQAQYDEWVKNKVAEARADTRQGMTTDQVRQLMQKRYTELRNELQG